jgi:hypothetical protein
MGNGVFEVDRTVIAFLFTTDVAELYLFKGKMRSSSQF